MKTVTQESYSELDSLKKSDIIEFKSFTNPPFATLQIIALLNPLFGLEPTWKEFRKLANDPAKLLVKLEQFDIGSLSETSKKQLNEYIQNPENTRENHLKYSRFAASLHTWLDSIYRLSELQKELETLENSSSEYSTLNEYMAKNCYFMFAWPIFYETQLDAEALTRIGEVKVDTSKLADLRKEKIIGTQEYLEKYSGLVGTSSVYRNLTEKILMAETARGNFFWDESRKLIITDPSWFARLINTLATPTTKGPHALPSLDNNIFKKDLEQQLSPDKVQLILDYVARLPWLRKLNDGIVVALFQLPPRPLKDVDSLWPSKWSGAEHSSIFKLTSSRLTSMAVSAMLKLFFSPTGTVLIWSGGILNRDSACDIHVAFSSNSIHLTLRVLDHCKQLNLPNTPVLEMARTIVMEYYLAIQVLLADYNVAYNVIEAKESIQACNQLAVNDCGFYKDYIQVDHDFAERSEEPVRCVRCLTSSDLFSSLTGNFNRLHSPVMSSQHVGLSSQDFFALKLSESSSIEFRLVDVRPDGWFIDMFELKLFVYGGVSPRSVVSLDLGRKTFSTEGTELNFASANFRRAESQGLSFKEKLFFMESEDCQARSGDCLRTVDEKLTDGTSCVSVFYNLECLLRFTTSSRQSIYQEIKIGLNKQSEKDGIHEPFANIFTSNIVEQVRWIFYFLRVCKRITTLIWGPKYLSQK